MGKMIELTAADGFKLAAYKAEPAGASKGGLVVIQEIFGVNHHIRAVADRFAAQGYTVIAPALFDRAQRGIDIGYTEATIKQGVDIRAKIKLEDSMTDIAAAVTALKGAGKVGVVGYCWGGSLSFLSGTRLSGVSAAVGYYGGTIAAHANEKPKVPVMLHFGEKDHGIPMSDVEKVKAARPDVTIYTYPADHGFSCDERGSFDKPSHEKAQARTLDFFKKNLQA